MGVKKVHLISAAFRMVRSGEGSKNLGLFGRVALIFFYLFRLLLRVSFTPRPDIGFFFVGGEVRGYFFILLRCLAEEWRKKQEHDVLLQGRWKLIKRLSQLRQPCIRGGKSVKKKHSFENRKKTQQRMQPTKLSNIFESI